MGGTGHTQTTWLKCSHKKNLTIKESGLSAGATQEEVEACWTKCNRSNIQSERAHCKKVIGCRNGRTRGCVGQVWRLQIRRAATAPLSLIQGITVQEKMTNGQIRRRRCTQLSWGSKKIGRRQHPDLEETSPCIRVREDLISICYRY